MLKIAFATLLAAFALSVAVPATFAAGVEEVPLICGADCDVPPPPPGNGGPGDEPPPPPPQELADAAAAICNAGLEKLKKVSQTQVEQFENEDGVKIQPVCHRTPDIRRLAEINPKQAIDLRTVIAANPALNDPLTSEGYHSEDVVGILIGKLGATLYVHKAL
jgi:hypothetical protein